MGLILGGTNGYEVAEVQVTREAPLGIGALYQQWLRCGFDLGVLVRCNQEDEAPKRAEALADAQLPSLPLPVQAVAAAGEPASSDELGGQRVPSGAVAAVPYVTEPTSTYTQFFQGYRDGGAPYPEGRIDAMIFCESTWRIDPGGYHLGLAQFDPGSWTTVSSWTGLRDWRDPYHQGFNVAAWAAAVNPGTSAGWPSCW